MLTLEMIQDAKKTLEGVARVTPLYESAFNRLLQAERCLCKNSKPDRRRSFQGCNRLFRR